MCPWYTLPSAVARRGTTASRSTKREGCPHPTLRRTFERRRVCPHPPTTKHIAAGKIPCEYLPGLAVAP